MEVDRLHVETPLIESLALGRCVEPIEIPGHGRVAIYIIGGVEQGIWQV